MSTKKYRLSLFLRNASSISIFNLAGIVSGLILNLYVAKAFGAGKHTDALFLALSIPNLFIYLSGLDSVKGICRTFIVDYQSDPKSLNRFLSNILSFIVTVSIVIFLVVLLAAPQLARVIAPGADTESISLITHYARLMSFSLLLTGSINLFVSFLNAFERFSAAAIVLFVQKATIFLSIMFIEPYGLVAIPIAYSAGALFSLLTVVFFSKTTNFKFETKLTSNLFSNDVKQFLRLFWPLFLSLLIMQVASISYLSYCSMLGDGVVAAFNYAKTLASVILPLTVTPMLTVALNTLRKNHGDINSFANSIILFYFITLCLCVGVYSCLSIYSNSVIKVIYERGEFTAEDTALVSEFYTTYLLSIVFQGLCLFFNYVALAKQETRIILISNMFVFFGILVSFLAFPLGSISAVHTALLVSWTLGCLVYVTYFFVQFRSVRLRMIAVTLLVGLSGHLVSIAGSRFSTTENPGFIELALNMIIAGVAFLFLASISYFALKMFRILV